MEAVLGLDTLRIVERLQGFISNSHLTIFFDIGASIWTQGGHSIPEAERGLHAQVCPHRVQTTPQVYGALVFLA